jgi:hypothetical protein
MDANSKATLMAINTSLQDMAGKVPYLIDTEVTGKTFRKLVVQVDGTTISVLTGSAGTNYLTLCNFSGKSLYAGAIISAANNEPIIAVTATAGQLFGYE